MTNEIQQTQEDYKKPAYEFSNINENQVMTDSQVFTWLKTHHQHKNELKKAWQVAICSLIFNFNVSKNPKNLNLFISQAGEYKQRLLHFVNKFAAVKLVPDEKTHKLSFIYDDTRQTDYKASLTYSLFDKDLIPQKEKPVLSAFSSFENYIKKEQKNLTMQELEILQKALKQISALRYHNSIKIEQAA